MIDQWFPNFYEFEPTCDYLSTLSIHCVKLSSCIITASQISIDNVLHISLKNCKQGNFGQNSLQFIHMHTIMTDSYSPIIYRQMLLLRK